MVAKLKKHRYNVNVPSSFVIKTKNATKKYSQTRVLSLFVLPSQNTWLQRDPRWPTGANVPTNEKL
jgi:hypothetical protein